MKALIFYVFIILFAWIIWLHYKIDKIYETTKKIDNVLDTKSDTINVVNYSPSSMDAI
jgi:hypothetical protein